MDVSYRTTFELDSQYMYPYVLPLELESEEFFERAGGETSWIYDQAVTSRNNLVLGDQYVEIVFEDSISAHLFLDLAGEEIRTGTFPRYQDFGIGVALHDFDGNGVDEVYVRTVDYGGNNVFLMFDPSLEGTVHMGCKPGTAWNDDARGCGVLSMTWYQEEYEYHNWKTPD